MTQRSTTRSIPERRRNPRVNTSNAVNFILFDSKKKKVGQGKGLTVNLSQSGVLLRTEGKLEGAFIVLMAIDLEGNEIKINGKIISLRVCKKTNLFLTGIEFIGPKDKQLSAIIAFVRDFQRRKHIKHQEETEELLRLLSLAIEQSSEGIAIADLDGKLIYLNNAFSKMHGYSSDELIGKHLSIFHNKEQMESVNSALRQTKKTGEFKGEIWHQRSDGKVFPTIMHNSIIKNSAGNPIGMLGTVRDISQRKKYEQALLKSEEKYRMILENIEDGYYEVDLAGNYTFYNNSLSKMFGYSRKELIGVNYRKYVDPIDEKKVFKEFNKVFTSGKPAKAFDWAIIKKDGTTCHIDTSISLITDSNNNVIGFQGIVRDITEKKQAEQALKESEERYRELSIIDDLTQLYNSRHFYNQLKMEIDRVNRYEESMSLILLDIDNFKDFNDTYGHIEGDQVLMRLGQVITRCLRSTDSAYRYGGEEFMILLPVTLCADGVVTAERIRTEFKKEIFSPVAGKNTPITLSIGVGQYKLQEEIKAFVSRVDKLMYQAKKNGKDRIFYKS
jgi:diguanylate cyclase (GGDEF)-like protein/PAS domain S-box-containing protein